MRLPRMRFTKTRMIVVAGTALVLWLVVIPARSSWKIEVDLGSGRFRTSEYIFRFPASRSIRESSISRVLRAMDAGRQVDWHPVVSGSPGRRFSPQYSYSGALHQARDLERIWESAEFTPEARRSTAREVLRLWRRDGDDHGASHYLQALWERAWDRKGGPVDPDDLPRYCNCLGKSIGRLTVLGGPVR